MVRTRWAAIGAAIAVVLGAGSIDIARASISSGDKSVTVTVEPQRILDTRFGLGAPTRIADETPLELQVTGEVAVAGGDPTTVVPTGATGVIVNVTVIRPDDQGFLSLRPGGATGIPETSTVNFGTDATEPNAATVALSADGKIQVFVNTRRDGRSADVFIDVVGYTVDHDHDDRYYTEQEVDGLLVAERLNTLNFFAPQNSVYTQQEVDDILGFALSFYALRSEVEARESFAVRDRTASTNLTGSADTSVVNVAVTAPSDGQVTVNSSTTASSTEAGAIVNCEISDAGGISTEYLQRWQSGGANASLSTLSGTRTFDITASATVTYTLFCDYQDGVGFATVTDATITAIFTPA